MIYVIFHRGNFIFTAGNAPEINNKIPYFVGVRGCPERDIPSLCVMGWGWEMLGNSSAAVVAAVVAVVAAVPPKVGVFWLPFPSRMGARIEISGHPSEHPAQNRATVFLDFHRLFTIFMNI